MDVKVENGFPGYDELKDRIEKLGIVLPTRGKDISYAEKYKDVWKTATLGKYVPFEVKDVSDSHLASFCEAGVFFGNHLTVPDVGNEYIVGRGESENQFGGPLYVVIIKPDDSYEIRTTDKILGRNISRIQFYLKSMEHDVIIARLGATPLSVHVQDTYDSKFGI